MFFVFRKSRDHDYNVYDTLVLHKMCASVSRRGEARSVARGAGAPSGGASARDPCLGDIPNDPLRHALDARDFFRESRDRGYDFFGILSEVKIRWKPLKYEVLSVVYFIDDR